MFFVSTLEESIRVEPKDLGMPRRSAVASVIEELFVDKVVPELGLVVMLYDVLSISSGVLHHSDGGARFKVQFRVVVFRPFVGEIIVGKIKKETKSGLQVSLGFFEDIFIPEHYLPEISLFNDEEKVWFWKYVSEDGEETKLFMELDEDIRFRTKAVKFNSIPTPEQLRKAREDDKLFATAEKPFAPMEIIGEIFTEGLGPIGWWSQEDVMQE